VPNNHSQPAARANVQSVTGMFFIDWSIKEIYTCIRLA